MKYLTYICILCAYFSVMASCSDTGADKMKDPAFRKKVEAKTGLIFPSSARYIGCESGQALGEFSIRLLMKAPKLEVESMFSKVPAKWSKTKRPIFLKDSQGPKWFKPDSISKFRAIETNYPKPKATLSVLIDDTQTTDSEYIEVYINWFEVS